MKSIGLSALIIAASGFIAFAQDAIPANNGGGEAAPRATVKNADVDEIDIEEYDDAALAANAPVVKSTDDTDFDPGNERSLINITCDDADLASIVRQFRKTTKINIIHSDDLILSNRVSISLTEVPWIEALRAILKSQSFRLDSLNGIYYINPDRKEIITRPFMLNHVSAEDIAELFNQSFGTKDLKGTLIKKVATPFPDANVVIVNAPEEVLTQCEQIIAAVDKAIAQICIEARFVELSSDAMHKLGIQWDSLESFGVSVHDMKGGWESNSGTAATYGTTSRDYKVDSRGRTGAAGDGRTITSSAATLTGSTIIPDSDLKLGEASTAMRTAESMAWKSARGFGGQISVSDLGLMLSAFESIGDAKVFSNPKIIVSNGKKAKVDMTTKVPYVKVEKTVNGTGADSTIDNSSELGIIPGKDTHLFAGEAFFSYGITLEVTPRISPDGYVNVDIVPSISNLAGENETAEGNVYPIIQVSRLETNFTMKDGSTAVIGGLSKTEETDVDSGIPLLRKIPWIGPRLFGWKSRRKVQSEIIVFVTIGIANPDALPEDIGLPKNAVLGREYTEGTKLEPGDRVGGATAVKTLDLRPIDDRDGEEGDDGEDGKVTIEPIKSE